MGLKVYVQSVFSHAKSDDDANDDEGAKDLKRRDGLRQNDPSHDQCKDGFQIQNG